MNGKIKETKKIDKKCTSKYFILCNLEIID